MVDRAAIGDSGGTRGQPLFQAEGSWMTATWTEGELVYLVAVKGDERALSEYLDK